MFVGKTRIVILAVRVLEKFKSLRSKPFFKVASRVKDISLTTKLAEVEMVK
jgi:hypothetical protein